MFANDMHASTMLVQSPMQHITRGIARMTAQEELLGCNMVLAGMLMRLLFMIAFMKELSGSIG